MLKVLTLTVAITCLTGSAWAENRKQSEDACQADVFKLCNDAVPDEQKIIACMEVHKKQLSARCAYVFEHGGEDRS